MILLVKLSTEGRKSAPYMGFDSSDRQGRQLCNFLMTQTLKEGQRQELAAGGREARDGLPHCTTLVHRIEQDLHWLIERHRGTAAFKLN